MSQTSPFRASIEFVREVIELTPELIAIHHSVGAVTDRGAQQPGNVDVPAAVQAGITSLGAGDACERVVHRMVIAGVEQFLDLGSGMLSVGPLHEVVHRSNPRCRVVYVDNDPIVTRHVHAGVADDPGVDVLEADMCEVDDILDHEVTRRVLDLDRPIGVGAVAVLHCLTEQDRPVSVLCSYHDRLAVGSMLAASHVSGDTLDAAVTAEGIVQFAQAGIAVVSRIRDEFLNLLGPWQPQADGVVPIHLRRQDGEESISEKSSLGYAVMATSARSPDTGRIAVSA